MKKYTYKQRKAMFAKLNSYQVKIKNDGNISLKLIGIIKGKNKKDVFESAQKSLSKFNNLKISSIKLAKPKTNENK